VTAPAAVADPEGRRLRRLMAQWATGVSVVTTRADGLDFGLTVNAFLSVSLAPPVVLVSLGTVADTTPVVQRTRRFGISILAHDQQALSERFAQTVPPAEKFRGLAVRRGRTGVALLPDTLGTLECDLRQELPVADHILCLGTVVAAEVGRETEPLLFFRSRYAARDAADHLRLPTSPPRT
jgi:flavin reductase (DIM6/NTAB) family NADH-FMN oxidoreductase RutF